MSNISNSPERSQKKLFGLFRTYPAVIYDPVTNKTYDCSTDQRGAARYVMGISGHGFIWFQSTFATVKNVLPQIKSRKLTDVQTEATLAAFNDFLAQKKIQKSASTPSPS